MRLHLTSFTIPLLLLVASCSTFDPATESGGSESRDEINETSPGGGGGGGGQGSAAPESDRCYENHRTKVTTTIPGNHGEWCASVEDPSLDSDTNCLSTEWLGQLEVQFRQVVSGDNDVYLTLWIDQEELVPGRELVLANPHHETRPNKNDPYALILTSVDEIQRGIDTYWSEGKVRILDVPTKACEPYKLELELDIMVGGEPPTKYGHFTGTMEVW